jgi:hypothetical protein
MKLVEDHKRRMYTKTFEGQSLLVTSGSGFARIRRSLWMLVESRRFRNRSRNLKSRESYRCLCLYYGQNPKPLTIFSMP